MKQARKKKTDLKKIILLAAFVLFSLYYVFLRYQEMEKAHTEQNSAYPVFFQASESTSQDVQEIAYELAGDSGETRYDVNGNRIDTSNFLVSVQNASEVMPKGFSFQGIPPYRGKAVLVVNNNVPFFTEAEVNLARKGSFEYYGELDGLGRCTVAFDCLSRDTMPSGGQKRGSISSIRPTGWRQARYDCIDSETVMTRAHLAGFMLSAENANPNNLITGTRYLNTDVMLPYENSTASYLDKSAYRHVLYRVTPCFRGNDLMPEGILMEAMSVEDLGLTHQYCVFLYNVQPGLAFRYATGASRYTGIFFDIHSGTVVTDGLHLQVYGMDLSTNIIHTAACVKYSAVPATQKATFYGDTSMKESWKSEGYTLCNCVE